jgi:hypothetical protein
VDDNLRSGGWWGRQIKPAESGFVHGTACAIKNKGKYYKNQESTLEPMI